MPPLRQMFIASMVLMLVAFGGILLIGSFEQSNGLPMNATIAQNFNALNTNPSTPSCATVVAGQTCVFSSAGGLIAYGNSTSRSLQSYSSNPISSLLNTVSTAGSIIFILPNMLGLMGAFIAAPLSLFMPVGFAEAIATVTMVGIFMFGLLSAVFLFPV